MFEKLKNFFLFNNPTFIKDFNNFKFCDEVRFSRNEKYNSLDLKDYLLDDIKSSKTVFSIYWNVFKLKDKLILDSALMKSNVFVITPSFLGREYSKTFSYKIQYKEQDKPALFEVLHGRGFFILEDDEKIKKIKVVKVKAGSQIFVPKGQIFTIINSNNNENLVCLALMGKNTRFDGNSLKKQGGASLFYTKQGFVRNNNIKPTFVLENFDGDYLVDEESRELFGQKDVFLDTLAFDKKKGIYQEFRDFPDKFNFLK